MTGIMDDRFRLNALEMRLLALRGERGVAWFVVAVTGVSVLMSVLLTTVISLASGSDAEYMTMALIIAVVVPGIVAPLASLGAARMLGALNAAVQELDVLAHRDPLTGESNRRHFFAQASGLVGRCRHEGRPVLVGMADLDDLKLLNDTLGHGVGDDVLARLAAQMRRACGPDALIGRLGGDEFALLVPGSTDLEQQVREIEAACRLVLLSDTVGARASLGLIELADQTLDEGLRRADEVLYSVKHPVVRDTHRAS